MLFNGGGGLQEAADLLNRSAGEERFKLLSKTNSNNAKYSTVANLSHSTIATSARRMPLKNFTGNVTNVLNYSASLEQ